MQATNKNNESIGEVHALIPGGSVPSTNAVASFELLDASRTTRSANCSADSVSTAAATERTPIGETLKVWAPVIITAIVVPGGIIIALAILVRRWYRNRAMQPVNFA